MKNNITTAINHPILIVGSPRSGTTLLRTILDQHPDLLVHPNEPQFILELYRRYGKTLRDVSAAVNHIAVHRYVPDSVDRQMLRAACDHTNHSSLRQVIACYLNVWGGDKILSHRIVLKDPNFTYDLDFVHELFSQAHIVHIVRDPRANVSSQRTRWPQFTVWECAMRWRDAVRSARQYQAGNRMTFTELRYEDLLLAPERTLQNLCHALDIPYKDILLSFNQQRDCLCI